MIVLSACQAGEDQSEPLDQPSAVGSTPEIRAALERLLAEKYLEDGNWVEIDGVRKCKGYLTKFEDNDFCLSEVPGDWEPFEYDGQIYYVQPLANRGRL